MITAVNRQRPAQYTEEFQGRGSVVGDRQQTITGAFYIEGEPNGRSAQALARFSPPARPSVILSYRTQTGKALFGAITYDVSEIVEGLKFDGGIRKNWEIGRAHV